METSQDPRPSPQPKQEPSPSLPSITALRDIAIAIASTLDLRAVLGLLAAKSFSFLPHSSGSIRLVNRETGALDLGAWWNLTPDELRAFSGKGGLSWAAFQADGPLVIRDVLADRRSKNRELLLEKGVLCFLGIPLAAKGEKLGVLSFHTKGKREFNSDEIEFLTALAGHAAIAIHNAQLHEKMLQQAAALEKANQDLRVHTLQQGVVSHLGGLALSRRDVSALLDEAVILAAHTLRVEYVQVMELQPHEKSLLLRAGVGWKDGLVGHAAVATEGASQAAYTLRRWEPVVIEDLRSDPRFQGPDLLRDHGVVSGISVVIHGKDRPYGIMGAHTTQPRHFPGDDINFLQAIANLIAAAVERQQVEKALAEQKDLFRTVIQTEPECVKLLAADGTLLKVNQAGLAMIEADSADEVVGRCVYPLIEPAHRGRFVGLNESVFRGESGIIQFELTGLKGTRRWLEAHAVPLRNRSGEITAALSVTRDITHRKLAEEALERSEERFRIVARATNDAIWDWNLKTDEVWWNEFASTLFRHPAHKVGATVDWWFQNLHPEDRERIVSGIRAAIDGGQQNWRDEYRYRCGDGSYAFVVDRGCVIHENGKPLRMIGCMTDITSRKQAEAELEGSHERLRALAAHLQAAREEERTRVAREIHDELGQALTGLKMDLSWMRKKLPRDQESLREKADSMLALMDQTIGSVRRISTELRPGVLDDLGLAAAIEWQIHEFQKRTGIKCQLAARLEDISLCRPRSTALFRIFQETLTNIARHAHATKVRIKLERTNGDVSLQVRDNGNGISKNKLSDPRSLGILGMRERALLFGGEVAIRGARGKGTTVTARIPVDTHD